ncbi:MAG: DUF1272 domain-containing protein [Pseudomonadota bacterium]
MLNLKPGCENCNVDLPPDSDAAMICSFECTFCRNCVEGVLNNVCPNCGGGFERRPQRVATAWRAGVSLTEAPASEERVYDPVDPTEHAAFAQAIRDIPPARR